MTLSSTRYDERRLKLLAKFAVGESVLDIGYAQKPNPYLRARNRVGLDLRRPDDSIRIRYEEEIVGNVLDVGRLLSGRSFDTIICGEIIEHMENPYELLRLLHPLLNSSGRLLVSTPNPLSFPVLIAEALRLRRYFYTSEHLHYFLPRWVERIFEVTRFKVEGVRAVGLWTPWGAVPFTPTIFSYQIIYIGRKA